MLKTAFQSRSIEPIFSGRKASLTADGKTLATTFHDQVVVTNLESGEQLHRIDGDGEEITTMEISPDGEYVVLCSESLQMKIFKLEDGGEYKQVKNIKAHESPVLVMTIDPTSTLVATGGAEGAVKVWDLKGGYITHNFRGHGGLISALKFFGTVGSTKWRLASGSDDCKVRVWDLVKSKCISVLDSHVSIVRGVDFSSDGRYLLSGGRDKVVCLWDISGNNGKLKSTIPVLESLESAGFLNDKLIYTGGENGEVRVWNLGTSQVEVQSQTRKLDTKEKVGVTDIIKHTGKGSLFSIVSDDTIIELDISSLEIKRRIAGTHGEIIDCCLLDNDQQLAIATNSPEVRIISLDNMLNHDVLAGHSDIVVAIDRSVNGQYLATAGKDQIANLWKKTGVNFEKIMTFKGHAGAIGAIGLPKGPANDPKFMITGSSDLTVKMWNTKNGSAIYTRKAHDKDINAIDISPDDRWFATASQDKTVKIWDIDSGESIGVLRGHRRGVWTVKFSHHDKLIATGSGDKTIKIWNLNDYSCIKTFEGHSNSVLRLGWISGGLQLASSAADGLVKVWDVKSGESSCTLDNHEDKVWSLAVRDDDTGFVSGDGNSVITVWSDITTQVKEEEDEKRELQIEQEQELENLIYQQDWSNAILLALELDHPKRLLELFTKLIAVDEIDTELQSLELAKVDKLLHRVRDWNTTAKNSQVAQAVLQSILKTHSHELHKVPGIVKLVDGILPYSDRHFNRLDDLLEQSYSLDYVLREMDILL